MIGSAMYRWWSWWNIIASSVGHPGSNPVWLLIGGCYCTSPGYWCCTRGPLGCANPTMKVLRAQIYHTDDNYKHYYVYYKLFFSLACFLVSKLKNVVSRVTPWWFHKRIIFLCIIVKMIGFQNELMLNQDILSTWGKY